MIFISRYLCKTTVMWVVLSLNLDRLVELPNVEVFFIFKVSKTRFYSWSSTTPIPIRIVSETLRANRTPYSKFQRNRMNGLGKFIRPDNY